MLSSPVVAELAKRSQLRERMVRMAWPDLSTESKLVLIETINRTEASGVTPDWLLEFAIQAREPAIVRLWAAKASKVRIREPFDPEDDFLVALAARNKVLYEALMADRDPLIHLVTLEFEDLPGTLALEEMVFFWRFIARTNLGNLIDWLETLVVNPENELIAVNCIDEFFQREDVQRELEIIEPEDGQDATYQYSVIERGWKICRVTPSAPIAHRLASFLPLSSSLPIMKVEELATLPVAMLKGIFHRVKYCYKIERLLQQVEEKPEAFHKDVLGAIEWHFRVTWDENAGDRHMAMHAPDREKALLDIVLSLKEQVAQLANQVALLVGGSAKKRGFFG